MYYIIKNSSYYITFYHIINYIIYIYIKNIWNKSKFPNICISLSHHLSYLFKIVIIAIFQLHAIFQNHFIRNNVQDTLSNESKNSDPSHVYYYSIYRSKATFLPFITRRLQMVSLLPSPPHFCLTFAIQSPPVQTFRSQIEQ